MDKLRGKKVVMLTADGVEQVEVSAPREALEGAGADVRVLSPDGREVRGYHYLQPGDEIRVDGRIGDVADFDALVLPGGLGGPDTLRKRQDAVDLVRRAAAAGKPIGVICHGPWLLIEADALRGRTLTCVPQLATDVEHAGARYLDAAVHVDNGAFLLVSGRDHDAAGQFAEALVQQLAAAGS